MKSAAWTLCLACIAPAVAAAQPAIPPREVRFTGPSATRALCACLLDLQRSAEAQGRIDFTAEVESANAGELVDLLVDDPDTEAAIGEVGQIGGRGASLMLGYFDDQAATEDAFNKSGWFMTGDLGTVDANGYLRISGRSEFRGEALKAERARVSISGVGDVKVWAVQALDISVAGIGKIDYWGSPAVRRHTSGAATINERGPAPAGR